MLSLADNFVKLGGQRADVGRLANPKDVGELVEPLRSRIYTAMQDAPGHGLVLVSGHRSPWQQYLLRVGRVGARNAFNRNFPGYPRTAIPYSSQHQKGLAADEGGTALEWLYEHRKEYGLAKTVSSELWHYEAVGIPTRRIIPYPGSVPAEEAFNMDDEARKAFAQVNAELAELKSWAMRHEAAFDDARDKWWKTTAARVRVMLEHAGIKDPTV
jgi:hypothetical protein